MVYLVTEFEKQMNMIITEKTILDAAEFLQIDKQTANNLFKLLSLISKPEPMQLLNKTNVSGLCNHSFAPLSAENDDLNSRCVLCGLYKLHDR